MKRSAEISNSLRLMLLLCKSHVKILKSYKVVAIVDPPRAGLSEKAIQQLRSSRVQKLIFVSSDPKATIRCLRHL